MFTQTMSQSCVSFQYIAGAPSPLPISIILLEEESSARLPTREHRLHCAATGLRAPFQYPKFSMLPPVASCITGERELYRLMTSRSLRLKVHRTAWSGFTEINGVQLLPG